MSNKSKRSNKILSVVLAACMVGSMMVSAVLPSSAATTTDTSVAAADTTQEVAANYGLADNVQDGQILQCWNWSYNSMKSNMQKIAEQGFSAVQTSPIQQAKESTNGKYGGHWWIYYQPAYFRIDNTGSSALGNKAEFKSMCEEAHKYGIKVIVDAVLNHTGNETKNNISNAVDPDLKNDGNCWHDISRDTDNYNNRWEVTQLCMGGLPDLNTANSKVQNKAIEFLKECIDAGADGFRFDGAKHIEVPDDGNFGSQFWPNVLGAATNHAKSSRGFTPYYYGEALDAVGGGMSATSYTKYMSLTDNSASNDIRNSVNGRSGSGAAASSFNKTGLSADKAVLWNESHDTFAHTNGDTSGWISKNVIKQTWGMVGTRAKAAGMFLARPHGTNETNISTRLGVAETDTGWADKEVGAINNFKNYFIGQSEYLSSSGSIAYNERGTSGVVIVNCNGGSTSVNLTANKMANGTYKDQISGNTFTVSGGKISGNVGDSGIAVVYNATPIVAEPTASITPGTKSFKSDTLTLTLNAKNATSAQYSINGGASKSYTDGQQITIGAGVAYGSTITVKVTATDGSKTSEKTETYTKVEEKATYVYFDNSSYNWSSVYAYIYDETVTPTVENGPWVGGPGVKMTLDSTTGYYMIEVPENLVANGQVIFAENASSSNRYPADQSPGMKIDGSSKLFYAGNNWKDYSAPVPTTPAPTTPAPTTPAPTTPPVTTPAPTTPPTTTPPVVSRTAVRGDANGDGKVDLSDAIAIQKHLVLLITLTGDNFIAANVNSDTKVDSRDVVLIQRYLAEYTNTYSIGSKFTITDN